MLTDNQLKYLVTLTGDKIIEIKPFDSKAQETAKKIVKQIHDEEPDLDILFMGAAALGIAGQNDIDLNALSDINTFNLYLPTLTKLFGKPIKTGQRFIKWEFRRDGFDVEFYLSDPSTKSLQEQIKTFEILKSDPKLLAEYEQIKLESNGLSFKEYMRRKYEFYNRILGYGV